jgi:mono/diheme cytochrome c family protein
VSGRAISERLRVAALAVALAACLPAAEVLDDHPCPPDGTELTYEGFGEPFLAGWCQGCHAAAAPDRRGAPAHVTFDDPAEVRARAARIYVRAAAGNTSMPPGPDDPPADERARLAEWLACGAP